MERNKTGHVRINATIMRVQETTLAVEKLYLLHMLSACVCSLTYAGCNAHAQYYIIIYGLSGCTVFLHIFS